MSKKFKIILFSIIGFLVIVGATITTILIVVNKQEKYDFRGYNESYANRLYGYVEENKKTKNIDVVFLGDSLTDYYNVNEYYSDLKVLNRGIAGDTSDGLKGRLKVSVYAVKPKVVTVLIGINNIDTMLNDYEDIVKGLKDNLPNTKIVLISLLPVNKYHAGRNEKIKERNETIKEYATQYGCTYADVYSVLYDSVTDGAYDAYTVEDGLHISVEGYQVITNYLKPILNNLLGK